MEEQQALHLVNTLDIIIGSLANCEWEEEIIQIQERNKEEIQAKKEEIDETHWERMDERWTPERINFEVEESREAKEQLEKIRCHLEHCLVHDCLHKMCEEFPQKYVESNRAEWDRLREKIEAQVVEGTAGIDIKTKEDLFQVLDVYEDCYSEVLVTLDAWIKELERRNTDLPVKAFETLMRESIKGYLDYQQDTLNSFESNIKYNHTVSKKNLVLCIEDVQLRQCQDLLEMQRLKLEEPFAMLELLIDDVMDVVNSIPGYVRKDVDAIKMAARDLEMEMKAKTRAITSPPDLQLIVETKKSMLERDTAKMIADVMKQHAEKNAEDFDRSTSTIEQTNVDYLVMLDKQRCHIRESFATRAAEMNIARSY